MPKKRPSRAKPQAADSVPADKAAASPTPQAAPSPTAAVRPEVQVQATRCPACGSTERERYSRTTVQEQGGLDLNGHPFTHVVRRWTRCAACGQARVERTLEQRPPAGQGDETR